MGSRAIEATHGATRPGSQALNALALTPVDGEPCIFDLTLAERLGFDRPRDIRKLVKRNLPKLQRFGVCATVAQTSGKHGGRPSVAYYLNQKQSIWVCMKSETERAFDVQAEIVRVFDAYLRGDLLPGYFAWHDDNGTPLSAEMKKRINRRSQRLMPTAFKDYASRMREVARYNPDTFIPERWTPHAYLLEPKPYLLPQPDREAKP